MPRGRRYGQAALRSANLGLSRSSEVPASDAKIARKTNITQPEKGKKRKNRKKRKKGKRTAVIAPRRRSVKVFAEKITPVGCHFLRKTAQPPDLDRAAERG